VKILLLAPGLFEGYKVNSVPVLYPRLGLRILDALTPGEHEVRILEGHEADNPPFDVPFDLVGISVLTPHAPLAYRIADRYRRAGVPVIFGGPHASCLPEDVQNHADAVVAGEAENLWAGILQDAAQARLQPYYRASEPVDRDRIPTPVQLPGDQQYYASGFPIESGRGCAFGCAFCLVPGLFGTCFTPRPLDTVIEEIVQTQHRANGKLIVIFSENLFGNPPAARQLAARMAPLGAAWGAEGDLLHLNDPDYLAELKRANCSYIYVESKLPCRRSAPDVFQAYKDAIARVLDSGIFLSLNMTIGFDDHDESIVEDARDLLLRPETAPHGFIQMLVPWPGTPLFRHLDRQGRILTRDWARYNNLEVVFTPKHFSAERLAGLFGEMTAELNALKSAAFGSAVLSRLRKNAAEAKAKP